MKKSTIMLIIGGVLLFAVVISGVVILRIPAGNFLKTPDNPRIISNTMGILESKVIELDNFSGLVFSNVWDVQVKSGDEYKIVLTADKAIIDELNVKKNGDHVDFSYNKYFSGGQGVVNDIKAEIIMPELKKVTFSGLGNMKLLDFDLNTLEIRNSGASNIEAENVTINQLNLIIDGAANAELSNIDIKNCNLHVSGAANIKLNMSGGRLTGEISGASIVTYGGKVSEENVSVSGIGTLRRE